MDMRENEPKGGIEHAGYAPTNERAPGSESKGAHLPLSPVRDEMTLQLREEELVAEKRLVQVGVVRIRKQVITETRTVEVVVAREEMIVERLRIQSGGADDAAQAAIDQMEPALAERLRMLQVGETLRLPIVEEEVIIQKRPMVTQELVIDKRLVEEVRRLSDTVRREDARITWLGSGELEGADQARDMSDIKGKTTSDTTTSAREEEAPRVPFLDGERTVELREEELLVRTQLVEAGAVEVHTGVISEQQGVVVRAQHEETAVKQVPVERRSSDRPVGSGEDIFDIPQYGERFILRKRPVVTEEITVDKGAVQDVQQVRATVRREEAQIEIEGDIRLQMRKQSEEENG
ncbi:MAG: YsnF/AvaK domain-containing protein [Chloroflexota bacterium]|nr:YsnF/AvaK domain-containing protein [Chloroflexota bacterium]